MNEGGIVFKKSDNIESGRTVLEAILVLVVLAIIGVFAAKIFMDLTNKNKAQLLEREVVLAHSKLGLQANKKTGNWAVYPYPTSGDYQLMYRFDAEGHAFIKLEGVLQ